MFRALFLTIALVVAAPVVAQPLPAGLDPGNTVLLDTKHGRIVIKLRNDIAPGHAERIKTLVREKFYDNVPFHRVIAGFMAQTGDGQNRNGTGNSQVSEPARRVHHYSVPAWRRRHGAQGQRRQFRQQPVLHHVRRCAPHLNGQYTVIGEVGVGYGSGRQAQEGLGGCRRRRHPIQTTLPKIQIAADAR